MKIYDSDLIIETHNSLPCEICGNTVHYEFIIPNRLWNAVMRPDGKETDKEYICYPCWSSKLLEWTTALTTECDSLKAALAEAEADAEHLADAITWLDEKTDPCKLALELHRARKEGKEGK